MHVHTYAQYKIIFLFHYIQTFEFPQKIMEIEVNTSRFAIFEILVSMNILDLYEHLTKFRHPAFGTIAGKV